MTGGPAGPEASILMAGPGLAAPRPAFPLVELSLDSETLVLPEGSAPVQRGGSDGLRVPSRREVLAPPFCPSGCGGV